MRIHHLPSTRTRITSCGRFVRSPGADTTSEPAEVNCPYCLANIPGTSEWVRRRAAEAAIREE